MRGLLAAVVAIALVAAEGPPSPRAWTQVQAPRDSRETRGPAVGSIAGKVTSSDTNEPIRWATVTISQAGLVLSTATDAEGTYRFDNLPPGSYLLSAAKAGFLRMPFGAVRDRDPGTPLTISAERPGTADFTLPRGGAIEGRVLNRLGDPAEDVSVQALRVGYDSTGRRTFPSGQSVRSDDLGRFRLHSLPPGHYLVEASLSQAARISSADSEGVPPRGFVMVRVFHPGTPRIAEAQRVPVEAGRTTSIEFTHTSTPGASIAGSVVDSQGRTPVAATATLRAAGGVLVGSLSLPENRNMFGFSPVAPGDYLLLVTARTNGSEPEFATRRIAMSGQNVTGLIETAPGVTLQGSIEIDSTRGTALPPGLGIAAHNTLFPGLTADPNHPRSPARVRPDGRFTFTGLVGPRLFRADAGQPWAVKAVRLDDLDVTDVAVDFGGRTEARSLRVVLTDRTGSVSGTLKGGAGPASARRQVVLFAENEQQWGFESRFTKVAEVDADGRFTLGGVLAGPYLLVPTIDLEPGAWTDPEVLRELRPAAVPVVVTEGNDSAVSLVMGKPR